MLQNKAFIQTAQKEGTRAGCPTGLVQFCPQLTGQNFLDIQYNVLGIFHFFPFLWYIYKRVNSQVTVEL